MSLYDECKAAGAIEPYRVASSISMRATRVGIQQALADIKLAQPQWFAVVEPQRRTTSLRQSQVESFGRRPASTGDVSQDGTAETEPP